MCDGIIRPEVTSEAMRRVHLKGTIEFLRPDLLSVHDISHFRNVMPRETSRRFACRLLSMHAIDATHVEWVLKGESDEHARFWSQSVFGNQSSAA